MRFGRSIVRDHPAAILVVLYVAMLFALGLLPGGHRNISLFGFAAFCAGTAVVEEGVMTGAVFTLMKKVLTEEGLKREKSGTSVAQKGVGRNEEKIAVEGACLTGAMFAFAHFSGAFGIECGILKVCLAFAFSVCMCGLYQKTGWLGVPIVVHAAFDFVFYFHAWKQTFALPPYAHGFSPDSDVAVLAAAALFFAVAAFIIWKFVPKRKLRHGDA